MLYRFGDDYYKESRTGAAVDRFRLSQREEGRQKYAYSHRNGKERKANRRPKMLIDRTVGQSEKA